MSAYPPAAGRLMRFRTTPRFNFTAGWQYLVQPKYRELTHERWRHESRAWVAMQIIGGIFGMAFTSVLAGLAVLAAWTYL